MNTISGATAKIRLVRCPQCRQILPEMPDVPVYKCGGCGKHLRAKILNKSGRSTRSGLCEANSAQTNKMDDVSEDKKSSSPSHEAILCSSGECSLGQNNGRNHIASGSCPGEQLTGVKLTTEGEKNGSDQNQSRDFGSAQLGGVNLSNEGQNNGTNTNVSGDSDSGQLGDTSMSNDDKNNRSDQDESTNCNIEQHVVSNCSTTKHVHLENEELSPLAGANSEADVGDKSSPLAVAEAEIDANNETGSDFRRSSTGELVGTKGHALIVTANRPAGESISSDILMSSPHEQLEQPHLDFDNVRSTETFETTEFINPSSELSGTLIDLSKSPTTRSSRAYYDNDVSSNEGVDDQLPDRHKYSYKTTYKLANNVAFDDRPRREKFPANSESEKQHQLRNCASIVCDKTNYAMKSSKLDRDEVPQPTTHSHPVTNWRRLHRDEYMSQLPFYQKHSLDGYDSGGPSNQLHNEFHHNSTFQSHDKPAYTEQEKMKLLRMVYELQDQLDKAYAVHEKADGRVSVGVTWKDNHIPPYYGREVLEEESCRSLNHPRYPGRIREGSKWPQRSEFSRIPFSAGATDSRHQVDHSMCCCPQDWQCPVQLPPPGPCHNKGICRDHAGFKFYNPFSSCPSSPQRRVNSEVPIRGHGTTSADQRLRHHEVKKYLRDKHRLAKRYLRPIASGAPFISCPSCLKQLQMPADFLLFKRRSHKLRCGACSEVLEFSLLNRTHLVPYFPTARAPPPSEFDAASDAVNSTNLASKSLAIGCPHVDTISCSDDYGLSFGKSCSTDGDPVTQTSFHAISDNAVDRNISYGSRIDKHNKEKMFVWNEHQNKYKNPVENYESAGPSSSYAKASSEIEELPVAGSPLHQLMGYSSPSELMYGCGLSGSGTSLCCPEKS